MKHELPNNATESAPVNLGARAAQAGEGGGLLRCPHRAARRPMRARRRPCWSCPQPPSRPSPRPACPPPCAEVEFAIQVSPKTTAKYKVTSKALASAGTKWECNEALRLCKQVVALTIPTRTSRVFVPDGPGSLTLLATYGSLDDGVSKRNFQARITTFLTVNNTGAAAAWPAGKVLGIEQLANTGFPWGYTHAHLLTDVPMAPLRGVWRFSTNSFVAGAAAKTSNVTGARGALAGAHERRLPLRMLPDCWRAGARPRISSAHPPHPPLTHPRRVHLGQPQLPQPLGPLHARPHGAASVEARPRPPQDTPRQPVCPAA